MISPAKKQRPDFFHPAGHVDRQKRVDDRCAAEHQRHHVNRPAAECERQNDSQRADRAERTAGQAPDDAVSVHSPFSPRKCSHSDGTITPIRKYASPTHTNGRRRAARCAGSVDMPSLAGLQQSGHTCPSREPSARSRRIAGACFA